MKISQSKVSATVLASTLILLAACGKDVLTVPTGSSKPPGSAPAHAFIDSTGKVSGATGAVTATGVTTIALKAGDKVTVTVISNECSGNPETVKMYGIISGVIASGSCAGGLVGQRVTIGPASTDGTVYFTATHQVFGEGPAGNVTGADPNYNVGLNDGYGDTDFNDVIITVQVTPDVPKLTCQGPAAPPAPLVRGQQVTCTVTGPGVVVTGWSFAGPAYNPDSAAHFIPGPPSGNPWSGPAVASGTVTARISVNGTPDSLKADFTVENRTGPAWHWQKDSLYWTFGELQAGQRCFTGLFVTGDTLNTVVGWNVRKGFCDGGVITPYPNVIAKGYTLQSATSGPNTGLYYVNTVTYRMDTQSNFLAAIKSGNNTRWKSVDPAQQAACTSAGLSASVNFFDFNSKCQNLAAVVAAFHAGLLLHEGYGRQNNSGHQGQLEQAAALPENDLYQVLEAVFRLGKSKTDTAAMLEARKITERLSVIYQDHTNVYDNWVPCGDIWKWYPSPKVWNYNPIIPGARCL